MADRAARPPGAPDPQPTGLRVAPEPFASPDAGRLLAAAYAELEERYGPGPHDVDRADDADLAHRPLTADQFEPPAGAFLVARLAGAAVGCVGLRRLPDGSAEVKRLFVERQRRGEGTARALMDELEAVAWDLGYRQLRLETGGRQPEAIALYRSSGWASAPTYLGAERHDSSVYFEKALSPPSS